MTGFLGNTRETVVRASSLSQYPDCARRWAARTIRGEIKAMGFELRDTSKHIGAATGSATHVSCAFALEAKMATGELGNLTEAEQRGIAALDEEVARGVMWDDTTPDLATGQRQVARQFRAYRLHVAAKVEPVAIEKRLRADHPRYGLILSGQSDLIVVRPNTLRDTKTGTRKGANFGQYGTYTRLGRSHGYQIDSIIEDFIPRVGLTTEQPPPQEIPYDIKVCENQTERTLAAIAHDLTLFRRTGSPEAFMANPASYLCGSKWCPAWGTKFCACGRPDR